MCKITIAGAVLGFLIFLFGIFAELFDLFSNQITSRFIMFSAVIFIVSSAIIDIWLKSLRKYYNE